MTEKVPAVDSRRQLSKAEVVFRLLGVGAIISAPLLLAACDTVAETPTTSTTKENSDQPTSEIVETPEAMGEGVVSLELNTALTQELEAKFAAFSGRSGIGHIFKTSELSGTTQENIQLIFTPTITAADGSGRLGTEIFQLVGEDWVNLGIDFESTNPAGENLVTYQEFLQGVAAVNQNGLEVKDFKTIERVAVTSTDRGELLLELRFIFETADGQKMIHGFFIQDSAGLYHQVDLDNSPSGYKLAALDAVTDGGVLVFTPQRVEMAAVIPADLFAQIKDKHPVLSADGTQIFNNEDQSEVLLEKVDGQWQEARQGVVAEAMREYGMPAEQAQKLEGLNVSLARTTKNVEGVLVTDNETGQEVFYFDYQTEFLVAVDRWPRITTIEAFRDNQMTEEELFSDEYFAWLKYISSTLNFDPEKVKDVPTHTFSAFTFTFIVYDYNTAPNFPNPNPNLLDSDITPFQRGQALGHLVRPELVEKYADVAKDPITSYAVLPVFYYDQDTKQVYPVIATIWGSEDKLNRNLKTWKNGMNVTLIITSHPIDDYPSQYPNELVNKTYEKYGRAYIESGYEALLNHDPSQLSRPGVVLDTWIGSGNKYHQ